MAFTEFERKRYEKVVQGYVDKHRPPPHLRDRVDLGFRIDGQSVTLFEIRPSFPDASTKVEAGVAKGTYVKKTGTWKLYWHRADGKWHRYPPVPEVDSLEELLSVVEADAHGCFYG